MMKNKKSLEKRFKILFLLVLTLNVPELENKLFDLANKINEGHPLAEKALTYYEDTVIAVLESKTEEDYLKSEAYLTHKQN